MRLVVKDKRYNSYHTKYTLDVKINYSDIPSNIDMTEKVLKHYKANKNNVGFCTFKGLNIEDLKVILSAVKRQEAFLDVDRFGNAAFYTLKLKTR